jgi:uncharacterized protein with von Willebrand factor type A (vWA) domain
MVDRNLKNKKLNQTFNEPRESHTLNSDKSEYTSGNSLLQLGKQDRVFESIINLYDFAEQLVDTLESVQENRIEALEQLAPLLDKIMVNAKSITEAYTKIINQSGSIEEQKTVIIKSLRELMSPYES